MIRTVIAAALLITMAGCESPSTPQTPPPVTKESLQTPTDIVSYGIGRGMGQDFRQRGFDPNMDAFRQGVLDGLANDPGLIEDAEFRQAMEALSQKMEENKAAHQKAEGDANIQQGKEYQMENASRSGVVTLAGGLQLEVLREGDGASPGPTDTVEVHYRGTLTTGKEFDSSYSRNQTATFPLDRVIPGWTQGLQHMRVGGHYRLVVPPELGYGERGAGNTIGPNATLVFEIELIDIK